MSVEDFECEHKKGSSWPARCDGCADFDLAAQSEQYLDPYFVGYQHFWCALSHLWQWVFAVRAGEEFEVRSQGQRAVSAVESAFPSISI